MNVVVRYCGGVLASALLVGCGVSVEHNLIGEWRYTGKLAAMQPKEPVLEQSAEPTGMGISLHFARWGKLRTVTRQGAIQTEKQGTWTWLHFDPVTHVGAIQCELLRQKTDHRLEFLDPDTIRLNPPNLAGLDQELQFTRVK